MARTKKKKNNTAQLLTLKNLINSKSTAIAVVNSLSNETNQILMGNELQRSMIQQSMNNIRSSSLSIYLYHTILKMIATTKNDNIEVRRYYDSCKLNYALVCHGWFRICQQIQNSLKNDVGRFFGNEIERLEYCSNPNNIYHWMGKEQIRYKFNSFKKSPFSLYQFENVKYLTLYFGDLIEFVNGLTTYRENNNNISIETIEIYNIKDESINWILLNFVNQIKIPNVKYSFKFVIDEFGDNPDSWDGVEYGLRKPSTIDQLHEINFETDALHLASYTSENAFDSFKYLIMLLDPISLKLKSYGDTEDRNPIIDIFHSISIHNHQYQRVNIDITPIPLNAFYRFLLQPNIHTLKIGLLFHQIFTFYHNNDDSNNNDNDNRVFSTEYYDELDKRIEDNSLFCEGYTYYDNSPNKVHSHDLWNKCKDLMKNHKTLTNLSLKESEHCYTYSHYDNKPTNITTEFIEDFKELLHSISPNISKLQLRMKFLTAEILTNFLDTNHTLNTIILDNGHFKFESDESDESNGVLEPKQIIKTNNNNIEIKIKIPKEYL
ncbi:hypothetical protein DLAC_01602 [Tieghemostelium lacteum]|uniref:Uncharacterized protein n=1 Tax=Tieghemostelium lacteum TaxID=361077 RepID=A0A152A5U8_TIELA|nr:hypothetical protein DLAC_01602 [Tieghemostelium lacteum]|eukprot:KYR01602.1 hypothetical protein DLAC_01602 [Tieghemostelium lacteum]